MQLLDPATQGKITRLGMETVIGDGEEAEAALKII